MAAAPSPLSLSRPRRESSQQTEKRIQECLANQASTTEDEAQPPLKKLSRAKREEALFSRVTPELVPFVQEIMYTEEQIRARAKQMGTQITDHYRAVLEPNEPLIVVGLLKGFILLSQCNHHGRTRVSS